MDGKGKKSIKIDHFKIIELINENCLLLSICIFISTAVVSQVHFTAEASQLFTTFKFKDSKE